MGMTGVDAEQHDNSMLKLIQKDRGIRGLPFLLFLVPLISTFFYGVVGGDKFILLSPLAIIGYFFMAVWMVLSSFAKRPASCAPPSFYLFLIFIAYGVGIGTVSIIPYEAKIRMLLIGLFAGSYFVWGNGLWCFQKQKLYLGVLLSFVLLISLYGLVVHFKCEDQILWSTRYVPCKGRLASTYICPNHFAHLLQMLLPFCFVILFIPKSGMFLRILAGYCMVVYVPTMYLTESRAGMLGSMAALGVTSLLLALRKSKKLFLLLLVVVPVAATLLLVGAWNYSEMFKRRMTPVVEFLADAKAEGFANTTTMDFRPLTWLDSLEMVKAKPVTGFGPGSYRYTFPEFRNRFKGVRIVSGHPHNEYLEIATEYGLIGFGLFAVAWCYGLIRLLIFSLKTEQQHHAFLAMAFLGTAAGSMLHSFFDFQLHVFQNALVFCLLGAIAFGPLCGQRQEALLRAGGSFRSRIVRVAQIGGAVFAIVGLLISLPVFTSSFMCSVADRLAERKKVEQATRYY